MLQRSPLIDDGHGAATQHVRRAHDHRIADSLGDLECLSGRPGGAMLWHGQADLLHERSESLAILRQINSIRRRAKNGHTSLGKRPNQLEWCLATELHDDSLGLFQVADVQDMLQGEGLEVEPIAHVIVCGDGLRIAVDHDRLIAHVLQGKGGLRAAVVKLDSLADPVRAATQDDDLAPRCALWARVRLTK